MTEWSVSASPPEADDDALEFFFSNSEPWFNARKMTSSPNSSRASWVLNNKHLATLSEIHGELFDPSWWQAIQAFKLPAGKALDVPPYASAARLHP